MNRAYYLFSILYLFAFCLQAQSTYYVKVEGNQNANALSWESATNNLSNILSKATKGDEIWIAEGIYTPDSKDNPFASFSIPSGVTLIGGFQNSGNPSKSDRNPKLYKTILSGDIGRDDKNIDGNNIAENATDIVGLNSYHVITLHKAIKGTVLSGLILTGGKATGENFPENAGGAIFNEAANTSEHAFPLIQDCVFSGNYAASYGGAIYNYGLHGCADALFSHSTFIGNIAYQGGAICNDAYMGNSSPWFNDCIFEQNQADYGGAIYNYGELGNCLSAFHQCKFSQNRATVGFGAAIYHYTEKKENIVTMQNCTFSDNISAIGEAVFYTQNAGIEEMENVQVKTIPIYPNPTTESIFIGNPYSETMTIEIQNISGEKIITKSIDAGKEDGFSLKDMPKGIYIILATNRNKALYNTQKVVKQ